MDKKSAEEVLDLQDDETELSWSNTQTVMLATLDRELPKQECRVHVEVLTYVHERHRTISLVQTAHAKIGRALEQVLKLTSNSQLWVPSLLGLSSEKWSSFLQHEYMLTSLKSCHSLLRPSVGTSNKLKGTRLDDSDLMRVDYQLLKHIVLIGDQLHYPTPLWEILKSLQTVIISLTLSCKAMILRTSHYTITLGPRTDRQKNDTCYSTWQYASIDVTPFKPGTSVDSAVKRQARAFITNLCHTGHSIVSTTWEAEPHENHSFRQVYPKQNVPNVICLEPIEKESIQRELSRSNHKVFMLANSDQKLLGGFKNFLHVCRERWLVWKGSEDPSYVRAIDTVLKLFTAKVDKACGSNSTYAVTASPYNTIAKETVRRFERGHSRLTNKILNITSSSFTL